MKTIEINQTLRSVELISYYKDSAYAQTDKIHELANELFKQKNGMTANCDEEIEEIELFEDSILNDIECYLTGYEYIECENQGSYHRHIWHKIN